jgi:hypothetical protein
MVTAIRFLDEVRAEIDRMDPSGYIYVSDTEDLPLIASQAPLGTVLVLAIGDYDAPRLPDGVSLRGAGWKTRLHGTLRTESIDQATLHLRDFRVYGGIDISAGRPCLENILVRDGSGFVVDSVGVHAYLRRCIATNCSIGFSLRRGTDGLMRDCDVNRCSYGVINDNSAGWCYDNVDVSAAQHSAFLLHGALSTRLIGCKIDDFGLAEDARTAFGMSLSPAYKGKGSSITGCGIHTEATSQRSRKAIHVARRGMDKAHITLTGNTLDVGEDIGIRLAGQVRATVTGNIYNGSDPARGYTASPEVEAALSGNLGF